MARTRDRDIAGYVERIGDNRWRLVMPKPAIRIAARRDGAGSTVSGSALMKTLLLLAAAMAVTAPAQPRRCRTRSAPTCRS